MQCVAAPDPNSRLPRVRLRVGFGFDTLLDLLFDLLLDSFLDLLVDALFHLFTNLFFDTLVYLLLDLLVDALFDLFVDALFDLFVDGLFDWFIDAPSVNNSAGTNPLPSVSTTLVPTVNSPRRTNTAISADADRIERTQLPVAGPNATPVEESPVLTPTKTATATPTAKSADCAILETRRDDGGFYVFVSVLVASRSYTVGYSRVKYFGPPGCRKSSRSYSRQY